MGEKHPSEKLITIPLLSPIINKSLRVLQLDLASIKVHHFGQPAIFHTIDSSQTTALRKVMTGE